MAGSKLQIAKQDGPIIKGTFTLLKYPGKGGWTYALLKGKHLMPVKTGGLFLPMSAAIRKKIGKQAGDKVSIELFPDSDEIIIPPALELCLSDDPSIKRKFFALTAGQQRMFVNWISQARTQETQARRIAVTLDKIDAGKRFQDK
jgi:hypothetical protein